MKPYLVSGGDLGSHPCSHGSRAKERTSKFSPGGERRSKLLPRGERRLDPQVPQTHVKKNCHVPTNLKHTVGWVRGLLIRIAD
ncbi:hypothetical protein TIFTF001_004346 [Ficus carica]|uniref:Uncharacterized protein n=1 Tax=Ficus carica TaxID=3494 RepID=A0AA87ZFR1_FICCA|nr:hypothetical protein TIFTF001_004346 [Ficus carica]